MVEKIAEGTGPLSHRAHKHLLCEFAADGQARSAHGTNHVPAARQFPELELFTKTEIAQAITGRTLKKADLYITSHADLIQGHGAVDSEIVCYRVWHVGGLKFP